MIKVEIEYTEEGLAIPDAHTKQMVDDLVDLVRHAEKEGIGFPIKMRVSTSNYIERSRIAVKKGLIRHDEIVYKFGDKVIEINDRGRMKSWPMRILRP